jgi:hypothetical protein
LSARRVRLETGFEILAERDEGFVELLLHARLDAERGGRERGARRAQSDAPARADERGRKQKPRFSGHRPFRPIGTHEPSSLSLKNGFSLNIH